MFLGICSVNGKFKSKLEISTDSHPELQGQGITLTSPQDLLQILLIQGTTFSDFSGHTYFSECYPQLCYTFPQKKWATRSKAARERRGEKITGLFPHSGQNEPNSWSLWKEIQVFCLSCFVPAPVLQQCSFMNDAVLGAGQGGKKKIYPKLSNL